MWHAKQCEKQLLDSGMYIKRNLFTHRNVNAPDVKEKREVWIQHLPSLDIEYLVFLDECGVNTNLTRIYDRTLGGERAVDKTPLNTTILSSIRLNGSTAYTTYSGGTTGEKFVEYLKNILLPTPDDGDIIVMDHMRSHHVKKVKQVIEGAGKKLLYLPPYSPDFNPIEKCGQKSRQYFVKSVLIICRTWYQP